jgi:hypothetical protein
MKDAKNNELSIGDIVQLLPKLNDYSIIGHPLTIGNCYTITAFNDTNNIITTSDDPTKTCCYSSDRVIKTDKYTHCPLKAAGFTLHRFSELGTIVLDKEQKCICTVNKRCMNVDKYDGQRCSLKQLQQLNDEAIRRRAWQTGGYHE